MEDCVLLSCLFGGPSELVLKAIAKTPILCDYIIEDSGRVRREFGIWSKDSHEIQIVSGTIKDKITSHNVGLVIGRMMGISFVDVDYLPKGKLFRINYKMNGRGEPYISFISISRTILNIKDEKYKKSQFRRFVMPAKEIHSHSGLLHGSCSRQESPYLNTQPLI